MIPVHLYPLRYSTTILIYCVTRVYLNFACSVVVPIYRGGPSQIILKIVKYAKLSVTKFRHFICYAITGIIYTMSVSPLNILVLGDSHVFWLDSFLRSAGLTELLGELHISGRPCRVEYLGIRGATVATFLTPTLRARIDSFHSDAAVICLGGNSISGSDQSDLVMVAWRWALKPTRSSCVNT